MNDIEKRARELLAHSSGWNVDDMVEHLGPDVCLFTAEEALDAVRAALTPPEGYADAVRDAARYRYIRSVAAGEPTAFGRIEDAAFAAHYGDPLQFDFNIDEQMAGRPEVSP